MTFDRDGPDWAPKRRTGRLTKPEPTAFPWRPPAAVALYRIFPHPPAMSAWVVPEVGRPPTRFL
jgi:hypothetical protein